MNKFNKSTRSRTRPKEEEQEQDEDEDDSITPQDMLSFSWQVAQGMVSERFFLFIN